MTLPNWFKIVWWIALSCLLTWLIWGRYDEFAAGTSTTIDIVVFVIWVALILAPLFSEVTIFGVTLKQEVQELKTEVKADLAELKTDIRNAVDVTTTFNPQIYMGAPPDNQIPAIEEQVKAAIAKAIGVPRPQANFDALPLPKMDDNVSFLISTRYGMEKEVRRIATDSLLISREKMPFMSIVKILEREGVIDYSLLKAIISIYRICSPAVHGEEVTGPQVDFVKDVGPGIIATLKTL